MRRALSPAGLKRMLEVEQELKADPRWQLIERITASSSFQKSTRIRELLRYMAERTLHGQSQELTEHRIGSAVFGKPQDYSVVEDSSVRVHVRQLRLRLHEYFDGDGRGESYVVEVPKGSYTTVFRAKEQAPVEAPAGHKSRSGGVLVPWSLSALFLVTTIAAWFFHSRQNPQPHAPWPLSSLFASESGPVQVVVADANYGMTRLLEERPLTLDVYLGPSYRSGQDLSDAHPTERETRMMKYLSGSLLTSYADVVVVSNLLRISGSEGDRLVVRSARELRPRDLQDGSYVFVGSPSSNPWVFYFQNKLNFQEREGVVGESLKFFQNLHPRPGEEEKYPGLSFTGSSGEDYATISLLPVPDGHGTVLILQGLQQEGTEAAGIFLADPANRLKLAQALGITSSTPQPVYFEALIRTQAVAGAPDATYIVATRLIQK